MATETKPTMEEGAKPKVEEGTFSAELREKTQVVHDKSDKLINVKLAVALTDTRLYSKYVADFYFVFQAIEKGIEEARDHPHVWPLFNQLTKGMTRINAFEKDLQFYLGDQWAGLISPSPAATKYCDRIAKITSENPTLLIAYAHSMWLALLAGGQLIKKVVKKTLGLDGTEGLAVYEFPEGIQRQELRKQFLQVIDELPLDRKQKDEIIEEKMLCFQMNNAIASSVHPSFIHFGRISKFVLFILFALLVAIKVKHMYS